MLGPVMIVNQLSPRTRLRATAAEDGGLRLTAGRVVRARRLPDSSVQARRIAIGSCNTTCSIVLQLFSGQSNEQLLTPASGTENALPSFGSSPASRHACQTRSALPNQPKSQLFKQPPACNRCIMLQSLSGQSTSRQSTNVSSHLQTCLQSLGIKSTPSCASTHGWRQPWRLISPASGPSISGRTYGNGDVAARSAKPAGIHQRGKSNRL